MTKPKFVRCFESHPELVIAEGLPKVRGGSCNTPFFNDCNIYIGFDQGMPMTARHLPWIKGIEIKYIVPDMGVPKFEDSYLKLVDWTLEQMQLGARVHAGCIGGHGRTGMFLSALVAKASGNKDAIQYVREHYCKKAVESKKQVDWLMKHFGVTEVKGAKADLKPYTKSTSPIKKWEDKYPRGPSTTKYTGGGGVSKDKTVFPVENRTHVWGWTIEDDDGYPV